MIGGLLALRMEILYLEVISSSNGVLQHGPPKIRI